MSYLTAQQVDLLMNKQLSRVTSRDRNTTTNKQAEPWLTKTFRFIVSFKTKLNFFAI